MGTSALQGSGSLLALAVFSFIMSASPVQAACGFVVGPTIDICNDTATVSSPAGSSPFLNISNSPSGSMTDYQGNTSYTNASGGVKSTATVGTTANYDRELGLKLEGGSWNVYKSGIAAQVATAESVAASKGIPVKVEYGQNVGANDRDTGKSGTPTKKWYSDGSMVLFINNEPVAEYANAVQKTSLNGEFTSVMYGTGTKIATLVPNTSEVLALNKLNGITTQASSIVNQGASAFAKIQSVIDNPDAVAKQVQSQLIDQASSYARTEIEKMAAQAGLGSLSSLKNMSNLDLLTLAGNNRLPISDITGAVNAMDLLSGKMERITNTGALSEFLYKVPGISDVISGSGAGANLASIMKGNFSGLKDLNGSQLAGALGMDPSVLSGFSSADLGKLLSGNSDILGSLGTDGLAQFMNLDSSVLGMLDPDQLTDFLGGDLSSLAGFDTDQLGEILGIDSDYLSSLDSDQLSGLLDGEYGGLVEGVGDLAGNFTDIGSTFTGSNGYSDILNSVGGGSGGVSSFLGGGSGGFAGLGGGGSSSSGGRGGSPLVPHGGG